MLKLYILKDLINWEHTERQITFCYCQWEVDEKILLILNLNFLNKRVKKKLLKNKYEILREY